MKGIVIRYPLGAVFSTDEFNGDPKWIEIEQLHITVKPEGITLMYGQKNLEPFPEEDIKDVRTLDEDVWIDADTIPEPKFKCGEMVQIKGAGYDIVSCVCLEVFKDHTLIEYYFENRDNPSPEADVERKVNVVPA